MLPTDTVTRILLAGILVCLVVLILQNLPGDGAPGEAAPPAPAVAAPSPPAPQPGEGQGRYRNNQGRRLSDADLVVLSRSVTNESLPSDMRVWAALQLQGVQHPDVSRALIETLDAEDERLAMAALQALAGNPDPRVRAAAERNLDHEDESVRVLSRHVLESID